MRADEVARVMQDETSWVLVPKFVRQLASVGALAFVLGRAVAPALHGALEGHDRVIAYADLLGAFATYLFAFCGLSVVILEMMLTFRDRRFGPIYRTATLAFGMCVISLVALALRDPLREVAAVSGAAASGALALIASREAMLVPRTRALGVLLLSAAAAAFLHLSANLMAWYAGDRALYKLAVFARVVATGSVFFDTLTVLTGFVWLSTRPQRSTVWIARFALFIGCVIAAGASRGAGRDTSPLWELVAYRAVDRVLPMPTAYVWLPYRFVLETCAPLLGIAALFARGQMPAIAGSVALVLFARPTTDVPLSALALTLAALATSLAARDDKGMWAVLMANSHRLSPVGEP